MFWISIVIIAIGIVLFNLGAMSVLIAVLSVAFIAYQEMCTATLHMQYCGLTPSELEISLVRTVTNQELGL